MNQDTPIPTSTTSQPSPTPSIITPPAPDSYQTIGAVVGIAFAVIATILGYRILRGGRGL